MSEGASEDFPKPSANEELPLVKEDNLVGVLATLFESVSIHQSLQQAEELKEDHRLTDELMNQVLEQATELNRELILRNRMLKKRRLLRELETKFRGSMYILVEATRAEFDSF